MHGCVDIGPDYAVTLRTWREAWEARREEVLALGYSDRFWRKYRFYFAYCEVGEGIDLAWAKNQKCSSMGEDSKAAALCVLRSGCGGRSARTLPGERGVPDNTALACECAACPGISPYLLCCWRVQAAFDAHYIHTFQVRGGVGASEWVQVCGWVQLPSTSTPSRCRPRCKVPPIALLGSVPPMPKRASLQAEQSATHECLEVPACVLHLRSPTIAPWAWHFTHERHVLVLQITWVKDKPCTLTPTDLQHACEHPGGGRVPGATH